MHRDLPAYDRVPAMIGRVRFLISVAIAVFAFLNLWHLNQTLRWVKPREADDVVILEDRLRFVRDALMKAGYWRGDVGYMPAGVLRGYPRTLDDNQQWVLIRYVMIPWNILQDTLSAPYVLVDGTRSKTPVETPEGFIKIYDSTNGLVVLKKLSVQ
jgi:hypothetical protein